MTLPDFLTAFEAALATTDAQLMYHADEYYPRGSLIRVLVKLPQTTSLPPALDPIGLVYFVRFGMVKSILQWMEMGTELGLSPERATAISEAADREILDLGPAEGELRRLLLEAVQRYARLEGEARR